ncbi:carboxypeptidase-like regulatory domain-containing protein [Myxococcota bacterium]|nr:carboxypeptidase-like regulatory domain-containing protein [Myxococcota bacterium]
MIRSDNLAALLASLGLASLVGCADAGDDDDLADDDSSPTDDDVADDDAADDDTAPEWQGSLTGVVQDMGGAPLGDLRVTLCLDICLFGQTDGSGGFTFSGLEPGTHKFDAIAPAQDGDTAWSNVLFPVVIGEDEAVVLAAPVFVPEVGAPVPFAAAGPVSVASGELVLTLDPATLDFPPGVDSPWVAGARIDPSHWPPFAPDGVEVLGAWALAPYDTEAKGDPIPVRVEDSFGLAADAAVRFWVLSYDDGGLVEAGTGAVTADGAAIETDAGEGLPRLTWVAVSAG